MIGSILMAVQVVILARAIWFEVVVGLVLMVANVTNCALMNQEEVQHALMVAILALEEWD